MHSSRDHQTLENGHTELQSRHAETRMEVADLSEQLLTQAAFIEQLQVVNIIMALSI